MSFRNSIVPVDVPRASGRQKYHGGIPSEVLRMAEQGMFPEEWCVEIGVTMRTIYAWANAYPEFEEALELAWHNLHAYWVRTLRENLVNPRLRQTLLLQILAKRFPDTWGQTPRNTLEHFLARNRPTEGAEVGACPGCHRSRNLTAEERSARIDTLIARRQAGPAGGRPDAQNDQG